MKYERGLASGSLRFGLCCELHVVSNPMTTLSPPPPPASIGKEGEGEEWKEEKGGRREVEKGGREGEEGGGGGRERNGKDSAYAWHT